MPLTAPEQVTGFSRFVPGLASIVDGARHSAVADSRAALTVWAVVVPQSLAYASLAGVPSVHGLYAAVAALAAYAVFGTCRDLNMGAESTVALMAAAAVAPLVSAPEDVIQLTSLAALLVGGWCVLGFVARLGFISEFLSRPILAGYVFGSGIIIVISQLESLFGLDIDTSLYMTDVGAIVRNIGDLDGLTTLIGLSTVVLVLGLRKFVPQIPAPLVAVVLGILAVVVFDLDQEGVAIVGNIDSGIPVPGIPNVAFDQFTQLLLPTLGIALLAYPDSHDELGRGGVCCARAVDAVLPHGPLREAADRGARRDRHRRRARVVRRAGLPDVMEDSSLRVLARNGHRRRGAGAWDARRHRVRNRALADRHAGTSRSAPHRRARAHRRHRYLP
jgi:hypothetical protein